MLWSKGGPPASSSGQAKLTSGPKFTEDTLRRLCGSGTASNRRDSTQFQRYRCRVLLIRWDRQAADHGSGARPTSLLLLCHAELSKAPSLLHHTNGPPFVVGDLASLDA
eukprot:3706888-Amphidinium_carterae.1